MYQRGQSVDIPHRVCRISNFQGTVAHEVFHLNQDKIEDSWKGEFGWHYCRDFPADWEPTGDGFSFKNKKNGNLAPNGQFTDHPEWCPTDYAKHAWDDDFADSGVLGLFDSSRLRSLCPRKLEMIKEIS